MMPRKQLFDLSAEAGGNMRGNECALKRIEFVPVFWSIQPRGYLFLRGFCEESTESWEVGFTVSKLFILSILISKILILILLKNHQIDTSSVEYRKIAIVFGLIKRVYLSYFASVSFWWEKFRTNEFDRSTLPPPSCLIQINTGTIKSIKTIKLWLFIYFFQVFSIFMQQRWIISNEYYNTSSSDSCCKKAKREFITAINSFFSISCIKHLKRTSRESLLQTPRQVSRGFE